MVRGGRLSKKTNKFESFPKVISFSNFLLISHNRIHLSSTTVFALEFVANKLKRIFVIFKKDNLFTLPEQSNPKLAHFPVSDPLKLRQEPTEARRAAIMEIGLPQGSEAVWRLRFATRTESLPLLCFGSNNCFLQQGQNIAQKICRVK